jgi:hypothetical protein
MLFSCVNLALGKPAAYSDHSIMWMRSQSGQIQVGPLLIPHLFSIKQSGQMANPQTQVQQKGNVFLQQ